MSCAASVEDQLRAEIAALAARVEWLETSRQAPAPPRPVTAAPGRAVSGAAPPTTPEEVESRLGGYWAARLGIVSLVTGAAFAIAHGFDRFGPLVRVILGYACAAALAALGRRVAGARRGFGQILVSGGLGIAYYTTYALHHVPSVQLIANPAVGFALLAASVVAIIAVAQVMCSETVAGLALFLGLHTGMVSQVGVFTLASGCLLAAGAAFFMTRNRWVIVPLSTLVAVYSTLVTWLLGNPMTTGAGVVHPADHLGTALGFVALYYLTFSLAVARAPARLNRLAAAAFAGLNWAGAALIGAVEIAHHESGQMALLFAALAASSLALAMITGRRLGRGDAFHLHLALASVSLALAAWAAVDGAPLVACLAAVSALSAVSARALGSTALRAAAATIAAIATLGYLATGADTPALGAVVIAALVAYERLAPGDVKVRLAPAAGVALIALATCTALIPAALITASWIAAGTAMFFLGLALRALHYRLVALGVFALGFVRLFVHDLAAYAAVYRIASFLIAGALLLGVSYVYTSRLDEADR